LVSVVEVESNTEAEMVERELHKRRLLEYAEKTERGVEPSRTWQNYHLGYVISGATLEDRIRLARKLASKLDFKLP
jgi:hypothetical protein